MKKKIVTTLLVLSMLTMVGCGNTVSGVTIEGYEGIELEKTEVPEITDEDVESQINSVLDANSTTTEVDRAAKNGDVVNIDYVGTIDGEEFDGGSSEDSSVELGSGTFVDGFEDQIIGHKAGETFKIKVTFPDTYSNDDLKGKKAVFKITLNSVSEKDTPELTDAYVKTLTGKDETVEEYKAEVRSDLEKDAEDTTESTMRSTALQAVIDIAEVKDSAYDEDEIEEQVAANKEYYENIVKNSYNMDMDDYLASINETEEDFEQEIEDSVKSTMKQNLVCDYIAQEEDIKLSDKEYEKALKEKADSYGYDDTDTLIEAYASSYGSTDDDGTISAEAKTAAIKALKKEFLQDKVADWILDHATFEI